MRKILALLIFFTFTTVSYAEIRFNGFATITAGVNLDDDSTHIGYDDDISFKPDTLFALQATVDLSENITATAQIVAQGDNDFDAEFEWAYMSYAINDNNTLSVGKFRYPQYLFSDFLDVRYTYHWVEPPNELYSKFITSVDGITLVNNSTLGSWDVATQVWYGTSDGFALSDTVISTNYDNMMGINSSFTYDWLTIRGVFVTGELDIAIVPIDALRAGLTQAGFGSIADELTLNGDVSYGGIGVQMEFEKIFFISEFTKTEFANTNPPPTDAFYASLGYRMDEFTFHYTYAFQDAESADTAFIENTIPNVPQLLPLKFGAIATIDGGDIDRESHTVGVKYDFHPSASIKFEVKGFSDNNNSLNDAKIFRTSVDLVF